MNVILNVQGRMFETDYDTLIKIPYFKNMFETCGPPTETIFVNRSSRTFEHVLAVVTDNNYPFPGKYKFELDFYGIDYSNLELYFRPQLDSCIHPTCCNGVVTGSNFCNLHKYCYNCRTIIGKSVNYCNSCLPESKYCNIGGCGRWKKSNGSLCNVCTDKK
jgi:hypothetical protein